MSSKADFLRKHDGSTEEDYARFSTSVGHKIDTSHKHQQMLRFAIQFIPPTFVPDFFESHEAADLIRETSVHPLELAKIYLHLVAEEKSDFSKDGVIAEHLRPFPKTDFERWGDANWLPDVSNAWFQKDGLNLDVQAIQISDYFNGEVTENDLVEYVKAWKPGKYRTVHRRQLDTLESRWLDLFGFKINKRYAESLTGLIEEPESEAIAVPF